MNRHTVNGLPSAAPPGRALLVVTDGLGYDPAIVRDLARRVIAELGPQTRRTIMDLALEVAPNSYEMLDVVKLAAMPRTAEGLSPALDWGKALEMLHKVLTVKRQLRRDGLLGEIDDLRRRLALERRYVPWIAEDPEWSEIVDENLTVPTEASGVWVGYEDVDPPVQGNSETGHQQIGNLALAPQIPLQITRSIEDGSFFENPKLLSAINGALDAGQNINFCFLLSGIRGSDGRVHSAWNHLEAFCELVFTRIGCVTGSCPDASYPRWSRRARQRFDGDRRRGRGYLGELERLLERYDAIESLAWVIGRGLAMDRDYREENAQCDYELLTGGAGEACSGVGRGTSDCRGVSRRGND